ncbi:MAG: Peptidyl-prolyl cis-trans isomerase [uncultured Cytophagales bacterium]|uniref:Peptidyl-prolyl cis-trans isomerase n=1 Tax=uncultured Cytophagales bacterium TaxID=158755 RepID=A0A6J4IJC5_9SPHI|nr:MAG: Peptidyl-prolyl cis-trans isomerase [uncultured Cytophagales bacterium]
MRKSICLVLLFLLVQAAVAQKKSKKDYLVTISTEYGTMYAVLYDVTPRHKANFIALADTGFYNGTLFHRIINGFMIQGGDPNSKKAAPGEPLGNGDVGYQVPAEFHEKLFHKKGVLAAARDNNPEKASSGCQFYIVQGKVLKDEDFAVAERRSGRTIPADQRQVYKTVGGTPHLDQNYTVFGEVIKGVEVIDTIAGQPRGSMDRPEKDIPMQVKVEKMKKKKITKRYGYKFDV